MMTDPVEAEDKFNYERRSIENWLEDHNVSPQTRRPMGNKLVENSVLRAAIQRFYAYDSITVPEVSSEDDQDDAWIVWDPHGLQPPGKKRSLLHSALPAGSGHSSESRTLAAQTRGRSDAVISMSQAMSKAFTELDPLRDLLRSVLDGWTPPKVVTFGDEGAGKSTVLEQLAMLPVFPRKRRFCTRLAIHLRLRRNPTILAHMSVYDVTAGGEEVLVQGPENLPQENGLAWVQAKMDELVTQFSATSSTGVVTSKIIVLEVHRPDVPSIDLIDLPGLTMLPAEKSAQVREILQRYVEDDNRAGAHNIYLVVVPASGDVRPNTNLGLQFTIENRLQHKTLGVFTKCDQCSDTETLHSLITGEPTADGDSAESLGAVHLDMGWVATMLKPPAGPDFELHNFERILRQQTQQTTFFDDSSYEKLREADKAGMASLVERLEKVYSHYLNTTWKTQAMKKVLKKLDEKEVELRMLGVVPESERDNLARQEVERRMGVDSPVNGLYTKFIISNVKGITDDLKTVLAVKLQNARWECYELKSQLDGLEDLIAVKLSAAVSGVAEFWVPRLQDILTAESEIASDGDDSNVNIVTNIVGMVLRFWEQSKPKKAVHKNIRQHPFIQLSQYGQFTDAVMSNCRTLYEDTVTVLREEGKSMAKRFVDPDSPWLSFTTHIEEGGGCILSPQANVGSFCEAVFSLFVRRIPSPRNLQTIHHGVTVGTEKEAALQKHVSLKEEIRKIQAAMDGIRRALSIDDAEFAALQGTGGGTDDEEKPKSDSVSQKAFNEERQKLLESLKKELAEALLLK
eukprot:TRINITY_DN785_c0_g1_i3.p1 TRINITY_DN785_c0_g1~~TRINITY_DN785_c0_g1_i3.p1  ORF type:complete len:848 (-),score=137.23 TRINITY_DN785_c0_g1_i3:190-2583(-)